MSVGLMALLDDVATIAARLDRWDRAAESPWTRDYLRTIGEHEVVRAPDLAARAGLDVPRFKRRVRQLKGLGLTISLDVGYRLSPRGRAFLSRCAPARVTGPAPGDRH